MVMAEGAVCKEEKQSKIAWKLQINRLLEGTANTGPAAEWSAPAARSRHLAQHPREGTYG